MNYYTPDANQLRALASQHRNQYIEANPFPHICLDNVFPEEALSNVLEEFPGVDDTHWQRYRTAQEMKLALKDERNYGAFTRNFINSLNSRPFLNFLEELTGIDGLIPDPYLEGGGLHQTVRGGLLKIHADFNRHPVTRLDRRLNVLIYLNKDWEESYGGHFELWDRNMEKAERKILPLFNRMAIFTTTSYSYHGHPDPLNCPEDRTRKSIALYYYTNGRPQEEIDPALGNHTTLFKIRRHRVEDFKRGLRLSLKDFVPPVMMHAYNRLLS